MYDPRNPFREHKRPNSHQQIASGYLEAGGKLNFTALDACFVLSILDAIAIHYHKWSRQDWLEDRLNRWCGQSLEPFSSGERLFRENLWLIHAK